MNFSSELGSSLVDNSGKSVSVSSSLSSRAGVALYFSAHWCPPCRQFTPILADAYKKTFKAKGLEIIFVSSDRDEIDFKEYFASMPWLALPFSERRLKDSLAQKFGISGIPALLVFDGQGRLVDRDGRTCVMQNPGGFFGLTPISSSSPPPKLPEVKKPTISLDGSIPTTKVQFRFPDGNKTVQEFNETATIKDLRNFVSKCSAYTSLTAPRLAAGFPPKDLIDDAADLKSLGLFDSVVTVKYPQ